ncbi:Endocytosis and vacuole integrity protein [Coniosporium apollinis]|uniref:Endocytosis and vacuole integrity protein n=1 Tax=Coniosporium apollinis TaxID=61459 RepID=A0ABQ9NUX4_9PEZI|nr:Endocytosis and vacuole integrity protein [Coniosporium apollinis]
MIIFHDLCLLTDGNKPQYVRCSPISQLSGLETIESILANHGDILMSHPEQGHVLRERLMPLVIRQLSENPNFPVTLRVIRILALIVRQHLSITQSECGIALGLVNHMLDPDAAATWRRALSMEMFQAIYSDPALVLEIHARFDEQQGEMSILRDNLSAFVRLASEKPALIGLGNQSTAPAGRPTARDAPAEQAAVEAGGVAGVIGTMDVSESNVPGISSQWSSLRTPCLDQFDKSEAPSIPETYIHSLVLTSVNGLTESLAKFVLPLTVHNESRSKKKARAQEPSRQESMDPSRHETSGQEQPKGRLTRSQSYKKRTVPINPLALDSHTSYPRIRSAAAMVSGCWPAILATCSTFLNAALDADYYRALVRSIQKFTQVAGLLRLLTPRDAFLTLLKKAAVPPHIFSAHAISPSTPVPESSGVFGNARGLLSVDSLVSQASTLSSDRNHKTSLDTGPPSLNTRNLLCLRALLNLAIALGPTLGTAWSIVFEALQQADIIMASSTARGAQLVNRAGGQADSKSGNELAPEQNLHTEVAAVHAAVSRLFESTVDFPSEAFVEVLMALSDLLHDRPTSQGGLKGAPPSQTPTLERRFSNFSGVPIAAGPQARDYRFALARLADLIALNVERFASCDATESGWAYLTQELIMTSTNRSLTAPIRVMAASILSQVAQDVLKTAATEVSELRQDVESRVLAALQSEIDSLYTEDGHTDVEQGEADPDVHATALSALKSILEQCGDTLTAGWSSIFAIILSVFEDDEGLEEIIEGTDNPANSPGSTKIHAPEFISLELGRSAFGALQLICTDFLSLVPGHCMVTLIDTLSRFCSQTEDLNISLTTVTFCWNTSDFLYGRMDGTSLEATAADLQGLDATAGQIRDDAGDGSITASWLYLLLQLMNSATDERPEVRHGAIHSILRIFENYGSELSLPTWQLCVRIILFGLINTNIRRQRQLRTQSKDDLRTIRAWNETSKLVIERTASLFPSRATLQATEFSQLWQRMLEYFRAYLACQSHELEAVVFTAITTILRGIDAPSSVDASMIQSTQALWLEHCPTEGSTSDLKEDNQAAFLAYVKCFREIYRLTENIAKDQSTTQIVANLESCIRCSDSQPYAPDVDKLTPLQEEVTSCIRMLRTDASDVTSTIINMLANIVSLPFENLLAMESEAIPKRPTFVAISKSAMDLLQSLVEQHLSERELFGSGALLKTLNSLAVPIRLKYRWRLEGKAPTPWQKATTVVLAILEPMLAEAKRQLIGKDIMNPLWDQIVSIADSIANADHVSAPLSTPIHSDETFDISALTRLRDLITPDLGSSTIPDAARRAYTSSLFQHSLIYKTEPGEIPSTAPSPLQNLYTIRFGRTYDPPPTPRSRMAYFCLSELFSLCASTTTAADDDHDTPSAAAASSERIRLAQAAAPYLILRCALPIKAYIADQPLRGRMPQPYGQRQELLFVLRGLRQLESEPRAIPEAEGVRSARRRHLVRLFPLLTRAIAVRNGNDKVVEELVRLLQAVGEEFGVE